MNHPELPESLWQLTYHELQLETTNWPKLIMNFVSCIMPIPPQERPQLVH